MIMRLREAHSLLMHRGGQTPTPNFVDLMDRLDYCIKTAEDTTVRRDVEARLEQWLSTGILK